MLTRQRSTPRDGSIEEVVFTPFSKTSDLIVDPPNHASFVLPIFMPSVKVVDEAVSAKVRGQRRHSKLWNSFEHVKHVSGNPRLGFAIPIYVSDQSWIYRGVLKDPYAAYAQEIERGNIIAEPFGEPGKFDKDLPSFVQEDAEGTSIVSPASIDDMNSHALKHMLPYIKEQLSVVNSIIELKDFKTLPKTIRGLVRFRTEFLRRFGKNLSKNKAQTLREWLRVAADTLLQWEFGIEPFVSDVVGIFNSLVNLEKRINALLSRAGTPQTRHYAFRWVEFPNIVDEVSDLYTIPGCYSDALAVGPATGWKQIRNVRYAPSTFHAEIEYTYNYTQYQVEHARLLALLDSLGFKLNPAIIWNAIPWSFVIDWVLRVGDFLEGFEVRNMEPQINIQRYLWTVRRSRQILVSRGHFDHGFSGEPIPQIGVQYHLPAVQQTCYKRVVGLPSKSSIESSGLSSREFTLAAALVLSRKRRYVKRGSLLPRR